MFTLMISVEALKHKAQNADYFTAHRNLHNLTHKHQKYSYKNHQT